MRRVSAVAIIVGVGVLLVAVGVLALIQRLHLYPGLARIWG